MTRSQQRRFSLPPDNNFLFNTSSKGTGFKRHRYVSITESPLTFPYNKPSLLWGERRFSVPGKRVDEPNDTLEGLCSKYPGEGPRATGPEQARECQPQEQSLRLQNSESQFIDNLQELTAMMVTEVTALSEKNTRSQRRVSQLTADLEELTVINAQLSEGYVKLERYLVDLQEGPGTSMQGQMMHQQGEYIMKVEGLSHMQGGGQAFCPHQIFGESFLTSETGYQMRLILYPCGRDSGRGTHLSVFFQIMQGPFDGVLPWPFAGEVIISLLPHGADQGGPPHTMVLRDGHPDCLQRPTLAPNQEHGETKFFPLRSLLEGGCFCYGDRLFLKMSVRGRHDQGP